MFILPRFMSYQTIIMKRSSSSLRISKLSLKTVRKTRYEFCKCLVHLPCLGTFNSLLQKK